MNDELIHLAQFVLEDWEMKIDNIQIIQGNQLALVWKITTDIGTLCLKRIHRPEKKAIFSIYAQDYLWKKGFPVPKIFPTKRGDLYSKHNSFLYIIYQWIEGTPFDFSAPKDLEIVMKGLAAYHLASKGYEPPTNAHIFNKLGKWGNHYVKRIQLLQSWKIIATTTNSPFAKMYVEEIDYFIEDATRTWKLLLKSDYYSWSEQAKKAPSLCHQDYGTGNTLLGADKRTWILDLDTTAFDLPIRDLRKMIVPLLPLGEKILTAYETVNPLTKEQKEIMAIDMAFPYELYALAKEHLVRKIPISVEQLTETMTLEKAKNALTSSFYT